jgi:thiol-disulfide isomerase/thioredoxin
MTLPATIAPEARRSRRPAPGSARRIVSLFAVVGLAAILGGCNETPREAATACAASPERLAAIRGAAIGELAAFAVPEAAKPLGDFAFRRPDGTTVRFSDFRGKVILVNLWATWCAPCRKEMPALDALQKARGGDAFEVVAVNLDTREPEKAGDFLDEIGVEALARYAEPEGAFLQDMKRAGRAPGLPATVLLDRDGCELGYLLGPAEWASADAKALVDAALAGR